MMALDADSGVGGVGGQRMVIRLQACRSLTPQSRVNSGAMAAWHAGPRERPAATAPAVRESSGGMVVMSQIPAPTRVACAGRAAQQPLQEEFMPKRGKC